MSEPSLNIGLRKVLNTHGYGFQYAVLRYAEELYCNRKSWWYFEAAEYPVLINEFDTKIDFILKNINYERYIIAECKRANPSHANWCFVRSPYIRRNQQKDHVIVENLRINNDSAQELLSRPERLTYSDQIYHQGFELRTGNPGESEVKSRGANDEAIIQVMRGLNGFIKEFGNK